jgi:hypothetical protein
VLRAPGVIFKDNLAVGTPVVKLQRGALPQPRPSAWVMMHTLFPISAQKGRPNGERKRNGEAYRAPSALDAHTADLRAGRSILISRLISGNVLNPSTTGRRFARAQVRPFTPAAFSR